MVFGSSRFVNRFSELRISTLSVGDLQFPFVTSARSLGVMLDSKLDWKEHVLVVCKRVNSLMYRLYHFRRSTNFALRKHLVASLLFPLIDYCSLVYRGLSGEQDVIIQRLLNRGIRYIYGASVAEHITPYRRELGWLEASGRRDYFAACMLYKLFSNLAPGYLVEIFIMRNSDRPCRGVQGALVVPSFRTESLRKSFHVSSTYLWNSLPSSIQSAPSLPIFKSLLYNHIFVAEGVD